MDQDSDPTASKELRLQQLFESLNSVSASLLIFILDV